MLNKTLVFKKYTPSWPVAGKNLTVEERFFDADAAPPPGGITTRALFLSLDPYLRGQMRSQYDPEIYSLRLRENQPVVVYTIGEVLKSSTGQFKTGDLVRVLADASEYAVVEAKRAKMAQIISPLPLGISLSHFVGALGTAGFAAYVSFFEFVPEPRADKTIFVSAASGGVGQLVGQIAKNHGMRVIGSTGSQAKVDFVVKELGFHAAWNYKSENTLDALKRLAPAGLDVYYDNVGGEQLEAALSWMKDGGEIVSCGMISQYNCPQEESYGIKTTPNIFLKRLSLHGFICSDPQWLPRIPLFTAQMIEWLVEGKIKFKEEVVIGIDNAPDALIRVWKGDKFGKLVLQIDN